MGQGQSPWVSERGAEKGMGWAWGLAESPLASSDGSRAAVAFRGNALALLSHSLCVPWKTAFLCGLCWAVGAEAL